MENESSNIGSDSSILFDTGKSVESMSQEDAAKEWDEMTVSSDSDKFKNMPRSLFLKRRDQLFERGFKEKLERQKESRQEESHQCLEKENERIVERNERDADRKAKDINVRFFGSEELADQVVQKAIEVVNQLSKADGEFLKVCMPNSELAWGDNPLVIGFLANLRSDPGLIKKIKENGLEHYISLYSKLPRGVRR